MTSLWQRTSGIPCGPSAVLASLAFRNGAADPLAALAGDGWKEALDYSDRSQLTLLLAGRGLQTLPEWVRQRLQRNLADNCVRNARMLDAYFEAAAAFERAGIEFVVLKGFAHPPGSVPDQRLRVQYDIDIYCPEGEAWAARDVLLGLGYRRGLPSNRRVDHLPAMVRGSAWRFNGNYFDPDMPVAIEPHFRLWDAETERFGAPGVECFWRRRTVRDLAGRRIPALAPADALGYAALHALRHWLRGNLKALHVYEIAFFLNERAGDDPFWETWLDTHPAPLRRLEALSFRLASEWFGCAASEVAADEMRRLPQEVHGWFERFAASPVQALYRPNKAELWLHWLLLDSTSDRLRVARRRLLPVSLPAPQRASSPAYVRSVAARARDAVSYTAQLCRRSAFHALALAPTAWQAVRRAAPPGLGTPFWNFMAAACLFNFGLFVFFLLYNLRLLELGYREDVLGWITAAMTAGGIAGTLPSGAVITRIGLRGALLACFGGVSALSVLRSVVAGVPALVGAAFVAGAFLSLWAVSIPPVVARLATERARPGAFSIVFATGIGMGVLGGLAGGRLPSLMASLTGSAAASTEAALLCGCLSMLLALAPASRLRIPPGPPRARVRYPRSGFVVRFLAVLALWTAAVGAFNPLFNAFFSRQFAAPPERIGLIFAGSQLAQVCALLAAPLVLKALGARRAVMTMQVAAGLALAGLSQAPHLAAAGFAYAGYMSFQYMSEPGLFTLLMGNVRSEQQTGASSLNFFVMFSAQALAATLAGVGVAHLGFPPVMLAAAGLAVAAGALFAAFVKPD